MDKADREAADLAAMMTAVANDVEYVNSLIGAELTKANNRTRSRMFKAACAHKDAQHKQEMDEVVGKIEAYEDFIQRIVQWGEAYPKHIFTEPTPEQVDEVCKQLGFRLDRISAMVLRNVAEPWGKDAAKLLAAHKDKESN